MINIIVARDLMNGIGKDNKLLYNIKEDMKYFKDKTSNHTVIMGRKTYDSLPKKPLPNRMNIVITRDEELLKNNNKYSNLLFCNSIPQLIKDYKDSEQEVFIMGGEAIYKAFLPYADRLYITEVMAVKQADSHFIFDEDCFEFVFTSEIKEENGTEFVFTIKERRK